MGYYENIDRARKELRDYIQHYGDPSIAIELKSDLDDAVKYLGVTGSFRTEIEKIRELIQGAPDGLPHPDDVREVLQAVMSRLPEEP